MVGRESRHNESRIDMHTQIIALTALLVTSFGLSVQDGGGAEPVKPGVPQLPCESTTYGSLEYEYVLAYVCEVAPNENCGACSSPSDNDVWNDLRESIEDGLKTTFGCKMCPNGDPPTYVQCSQRATAFDSVLDPFTVIDRISVGPVSGEIVLGDAEAITDQTGLEVIFVDDGEVIPPDGIDLNALYCIEYIEVSGTCITCIGCDDPCSTM